MKPAGRRSSITGLSLPEVTYGSTGLRGLRQNKKCLGFALFASLGGVLYGYNQVRPRCYRFALSCSLTTCCSQGVFGQVQVMADFEHRFADTVSRQSSRTDLMDPTHVCSSSTEIQPKVFSPEF
jgi:hypothetical protein